MVVALKPTMRHPASLVPVSEHDPALLDLLAATPSSRLLSYIAERAAEVVPVRMPPSSGLYTPPATPIKATHAEASPPQAVASPALVSLETFIRGVAIKSQVRTPTLLVTLVLLNRLKLRLPEIAKGASDASTSLTCRRSRLASPNLARGVDRGSQEVCRRLAAF